MPRGVPSCPENANWLAALRELREETTVENHKLTLGRAYRSLASYKEPVYTFADFLVVPHVGQWIATSVESRLTNGMASQRAANAAMRRRNVHVRQPTQTEQGQHARTPCTTQQVASGAIVLPDSDEEMTPATLSASATSGDQGRSSTFSERPRRPYTPTYGSSPFAALIALLNAECETPPRMELLENDLVTLARPYTDTLMRVRSTGNIQTRYDGMSSVRKQLVGKLVTKWTKPKRFSLTDEGRKVAQDCLQMHTSASERTIVEYRQVANAESEPQEEDIDSVQTQGQPHGQISTETRNVESICVEASETGNPVLGREILEMLLVA